MTDLRTQDTPGTAVTTSVRRRLPFHSTDSTALLRALLILLFALPSGLVVGPLGAAGSPANVLAMLMYVWWFNARLAPQVGVDRGRQPIRVALYALQVAVGLSYVAGMLRPIGGDEISSSDRGILSLIAWSGILLVAADGLRSRRALDRILRFLVGCGIFLAVLGIVQFFSGFNPVGSITIPGLVIHRPYGLLAERSNFPRVVGTASHPIEFGVVLAFILPLAMHYAWNSEGRERTRRWVGVLLIGAALPMTVARSAILSAAVVLLVALITTSRRQRWTLLRWLPVFAVVMRLLVPGLLGTIRSLFTNIRNDPSTLGRTADYDAVRYYVSQRPFFGRGIGTYLPENNRVLDNTYLGWSIEVGLVGLILLIGLLLTGVVLAFGIRARSTDETTRSLAAALAAALLAAAVSYGTFDGLSFPLCTGVMFLLLGATGALWRLTVTGPESRPVLLRPAPALRIRARRAAQIVGVAILIAIPAIIILPSNVGTYQSGGAVILQGPPLTAKNPYIYAPPMDIPSTILQRILQSDSTKLKLARAGATASYTAAAGDGSLAPYTDRVQTGSVIRVLAVSKDPAMALHTRDAVIDELRNELQSVQSAAGGPRGRWIQSTVLVRPTSPVWLPGAPKRADLGLFLLMLFASRVLLMRPAVRRGIEHPREVLGPLTGSTPGLVHRPR